MSTFYLFLDKNMRDFVTQITFISLFLFLINDGFRSTGEPVQVEFLLYTISTAALPLRAFRAVCRIKRFETHKNAGHIRNGTGPAFLSYLNTLDVADQRRNKGAWQNERQTAGDSEISFIVSKF